jgi:hypothetical protein
MLLWNTTDIFSAYTEEKYFQFFSDKKNQLFEVEKQVNWLFQISGQVLDHK